jgi:hypothetical protein
MKLSIEVSARSRATGPAVCRSKKVSWAKSSLAATCSSSARVAAPIASGLSPAPSKALAVAIRASEELASKAARKASRLLLKCS